MYEEDGSQHAAVGEAVSAEVTSHMENKQRDVEAGQVRKQIFHA